MNVALPLRRRGHAERRVLRLIRGEGLEREPTPGARPPRRVPPSATSSQLAHFTRLRSLAMRNGFQIQATGAPYVSADELRLLAWIAACQRVAGRDMASHSDHAFVRAVGRCADTLVAIGLRLPPLTLYATQLCHNGAGRPVPADITSEVRSTATGG